MPLLTRPDITITHLMLAAIHLNDKPGDITLNDDHPGHERFGQLWEEALAARSRGVVVMGMLGGAAKGTFTRLDGTDTERFESYYTPLRDLVRSLPLDGLDLDVEENTTLAGIVRLIDRLRADFGKSFVISLAPVAAALVSRLPEHNLSGFDYEALEVMRGREIAFYNAQFYCGWGDMSTPAMYDLIMARGWPADKVVVGLITNPANGAGFVDWGVLGRTLRTIKTLYPNFGGVMGWEYFNSLPGGLESPWEWAWWMTRTVRDGQEVPVGPGGIDRMLLAKGEAEKVADSASDSEETYIAPVPRGFEYYSEGASDSD